MSQPPCLHTACCRTYLIDDHRGGDLNVPCGCIDIVERERRAIVGHEGLEVDLHGIVDLPCTPHGERDGLTAMELSPMQEMVTTWS